MPCPSPSPSPVSSSPPSFATAMAPCSTSSSTTSSTDNSAAAASSPATATAAAANLESPVASVALSTTKSSSVAGPIEPQDHEEDEEDEQEEVEGEPVASQIESTTSSSASASSKMPRRFFSSRKSSKASKSSSKSSLSDSSSSSSSMGLDRALFLKLEEVTSELDRLSRVSNALPQTRELEVVQTELKRAQRDSCQLIQSQRELLDKIERQERSSFRRYFQFNRELKVETLKTKLWERMSESASMDRELLHLERKSDTLLEARRTTFSGDSGESMEAAQLSWRMEELERERQDIVGNLLCAIPTTVAPETKQLSTRIAMYVSEIRASESIQKQVDRCAAMYREALRNLQAALAVLLAPTYSGTLKEFVTGPYLLAVEACHQIEAACHVLQPEARRRYRRYAPDLLHVRPPRFPQAIVDFAKRARVNYDRKSALSVEGTRKLHAAENICVLLHRIVIQKLELINQWRSEVEQDVARAGEAHARAEKRLQQQMKVLARSVSV